MKQIEEIENEKIKTALQNFLNVLEEENAVLNIQYSDRKSVKITDCEIQELDEDYVYDYDEAGFMPISSFDGELPSGIIAKKGTLIAYFE